MTIRKHRQKKNRGFTLLVAVITASIVLAIGMSILNITLKMFLLSNVARDSEMAFYAADAGMECALYWDESTADGVFDIGASGGTISCMESSINIPAVSAGATREFEISWGGGATPPVCAIVSVKKDDSTSGAGCPAGVVCTTVVSSGYNRACSALSDPRTVERRLRTRY